MHLRKIATSQEMRASSDPEIMEYVRPRRRPDYLDTWNLEIFQSRTKSWKNKRRRKQWG